VRLYWRLRGHQEKTQIVALNGAYHGSSTGAASLTGLPYFHQYYEPLLPGVLRMARPYCYRCELGLSYPACALACADELERLIAREGAERIGAFIAEPVQGVGGVVIPPPGYFERIREICDRHDILLVVDEVITGFGRTGRAFGIQHSRVTPDMLVFAKGVTSGYAPLGGVVLHQRVYQALLEAGPGFTLHHGFTYSGHPAACAAGLANLDILERERLIPAVRTKSAVLKKCLTKLARRHAMIGDVRVAGLMAALELVRDRESKQPFPEERRVSWAIRQAALRRGLILRASGDRVVLCPPLVVSEGQIADMVAVLDEAIAEVAQ
jgi:adenosylmethionine-8-amino-7-oxononanoate aminotransferase